MSSRELISRNRTARLERRSPRRTTVAIDCVEPPGTPRESLALCPARHHGTQGLTPVRMAFQHPQCWCGIPQRDEPLASSRRPAVGAGQVSDQGVQLDDLAGERGGSEAGQPQAGGRILLRPEPKAQQTCDVLGRDLPSGSQGRGVAQEIRTLHPWLPRLWCRRRYV